MAMAAMTKEMMNNVAKKVLHITIRYR